MRWRRAVALLLVIAGLCGLFVHYGAVAADHDPYPSNAELRAGYDAHAGEAIFRWATVVEVEPNATVVESGDVRFRLTEPVPGADPGDAIQVYGTLRPGYRIDPERAIVSDESSLLGLYLVSAVGALLTAGAFLRSWRVDLRRFAFEPRGDDD